MPTISSHRTAPLIFRACLPSAGSFAACALIGSLFALGIILSVGTQEETAANAAIQFIIAPLALLIDAERINQMLYIFLWACLGALTYELLRAIVHTVAEWRDIAHSVSFSNNPRRLRQSLFWSSMGRLLWRWAIWIIAIGGFVLITPLLRHVGAAATLAVTQGMSWQTVIRVFLLIALGGGIAHFTLVLMRLYMFRTRLYGEILY